MKKTWISSAHRGFVAENMAQNTLSAYLLAAKKGADMIEVDARMSRDGVLVVNHDPTAKGFDSRGNAVEFSVAETDSSILRRIILAPNDPAGVQTLPTLEEALRLAYFTGMQINIDLKNGIDHAEEIAKLVCAYGLRGRTVYATNGAGADAIHLIRKIDPDARFIDQVKNFTAKALESVDAYQKSCFAYTSDFSDENIRRVRESGCMLATISLNPETADRAFAHHPDMAEYLHSSDFEAIDRAILSSVKLA